MSASRRSFLAATGAGIASLGTVGAVGASPAAGADAAELFQRSAEANRALMRGQADQYRTLVAISDDFTLMSPFGGPPSHASQITNESWKAMGLFFRNGTFEQELVQSYASADMVVLAIIERAHVEVGGLPAQEWPLRVTLVYRRDGAEWRLAHRHADPLVRGVGLAKAAALARGEAP